VTFAIIVAPKFDEPTSYSYDWSREVKKMLEEKGFHVIDIGGEPLSRAEVEKALTENPNALFIFYNHGNEDCLWASQTEKAVDLKNVQLLASRENYTMACLSAKTLGVEAYKNGAIAYWGYVEVFSFSTEALDEFRTFANAGLKFKLEGKTWEESLKLAKELADKLCQKLVEAGKYVASVLLKQDADALRCYTPNNPPTSNCTLRKTAIRLLGPKLGWKISRKHALSILFFGIGWGLTVHDFFVECNNPLRFPPHGFWYGILLVTTGFFLSTYEFVSWLRKS
jgi:hypothetical protein